MNVLITGASGFVGSQMAAHFISRGDRVRGLVRPGSAPLTGGVERVESADIAEAGVVAEAADGMDVVIHLAARVHVMRDQSSDPLAEFRSVNVAGTAAVLKGAEEAGVKRLIFASSVKAVGESNSAPWTEDTLPAPVDPYGISKLEAEHLVRRFDRPGSLRTTILRLPAVYGPGMRGNVLRLFELVDRRVPMPLGAISNRRSLLYVGNLIAATDAVLRCPHAAGQTFFVNDGEDLSTPELVRRIGAALGRPALILPISEPFLRAAGRMVDRVRTASSIPFTSPVTDRLLGSLTVDCTKLKVITGFDPPFTNMQALNRTAEWFRSRDRNG